MPLPGGNLTGLLRPENDGDGLRLTTRGDPAGDAGLYLVVGGFPVRLPLDETLRVRPDGDGSPFEAESNAVFARHDAWLFGVRLVTLHYRIT